MLKHCWSDKEQQQTHSSRFLLCMIFKSFTSIKSGTKHRQVVGGLHSWFLCSFIEENLQNQTQQPNFKVRLRFHSISHKKRFSSAYSAE